MTTTFDSFVGFSRLAHCHQLELVGTVETEVESRLQPDFPSRLQTCSSMVKTSDRMCTQFYDTTSASKSSWMSCQGWFRLMVRILILCALSVYEAERGEPTVG